MADPVTDYARKVRDGEIVAGRLVRLACDRHLRDLESGHERGLTWDVKAAQRAIDWFGFLRLGDGEPFKLQPFQIFKTGSLFGWKGRDGFRRFRTAYIEEAKGSGKTPWAGGVLIYLLVADKEPEAQCYCAAVTREQAAIAFRDAKRLAESSPFLQKHLDIGQNNIAHLAKGGFLRTVSSEHRGLDGKRVHAAVLDEIHEHPTPLVADKIRAGTKARRQALIIEITNSGHDRTTVCWTHHQYSVKVLEGLIEDDSWFCYVCTLDPCEKCRGEGQTQPAENCPDCDQWDDEKVWPKANPGLDTILPRKYLREQVREAKGMPSKEGIVKRLNFCIWTNTVTAAIPMDAWDRCTRQIDRNSLGGREAYAGLDIGSTSDFTALALIFPHDDGETIEVPDPQTPDGPKLTQVRRTFSVLPWFWLPESPVRRDPHMTAVIDGWRRQGLIKTTSGNVVDYDVVLQDIVTLTEEFNVGTIAVDRGFQGAQMCTNLVARFGEEMVKVFPQGVVSMNAPFRELIELVKLGRLHHDGNPVLRWMASNCASEENNGLIKPSKKKSTEKIDGIAALTMALGVALVAAPPAEVTVEVW